jgi:hypothetical protein
MDTITITEQADADLIAAALARYHEDLRAGTPLARVTDAGTREQIEHLWSRFGREHICSPDTCGASPA